MLGGTWLQEGQQSVNLTHTSTADWQSSWAFSYETFEEPIILSGIKNLILFCTFQKQIDTGRDMQIKAERNKGMDKGTGRKQQNVPLRTKLSNNIHRRTR